MDMITTMERVLRYLEDHLNEEVDYHEVAREVHYSAFHLHRVFSLLTGLSMTQYVRNRRLSEAAIDLQTTSRSVMDIALAYCYDSPEGFQKAFQRFHGVNPSAVRHHGANVSCYHPLQLHLTYQGGQSMTHRLVPQEPFQLLVVSRTFANDIIGDDDNTDIATFWQECLQDGTVNHLQKLTGTQDLFSPCASVSDESKTFRYGIGCRYEGEPMEGFTPGPSGIPCTPSSRFLPSMTSVSPGRRSCRNSFPARRTR